MALPPPDRAASRLAGSRGADPEPASRPTGPVLHLVTCGGHPAVHLVDVTTTLVARGWDVHLLATSSGLAQLDVPELLRVTGNRVRHGIPDGDGPLPVPAAVAVAPAGFSVINSWAAGIGECVALLALHEVVAGGIPAIAVPYPTTRLARHPTFLRSLDRLRDWGVEVIFDPHRYPLPTPAMGNTAARLFPWAALTRSLARTWLVLHADQP